MTIRSPGRHYCRKLVHMKDKTLPEGPWEFNTEVAAVFEDMLERSIPDYEKMRLASCAIAAPALRDDEGRVLDLGCANGMALSRLDTYTACEGSHIHRLVGLDVSAAMLEKAEERFKGDDRYHFLNHDLKTHFPFPDASFDVVMCVLTLQFLPIVHRLRIMDEINRILVPGGRLVFVEKILGFGNLLDQDMVDIYHEHKRDMGYTEEQIERKRLSLEGVMTPISASWNEELLEKAGFIHKDVFWRWMNFAGWIAVK